MFLGKSNGVKDMQITIWMLIKAWFKKLCGVQSPTQYIHGYKYQYDWLKALRREQKSKWRV